MHTTLYKSLGVLFNKSRFEHTEDLELMVHLLRDYASMNSWRGQHPYLLATASAGVEEHLDSFIRGHVDVDAFDNVIVFGSAADGTFSPGWSDYDILVVLKDGDVAKQRDEISKINDWVAQYNHHGVSVVLREMLTQWCQTWIPLHVLANGYSYIKQSYDCLYYNDRPAYKDLLCYWAGYFEEAAASGIFRHHIHDGKYLTNNPSELLDRLYQFKYFLSVVFLLPCFFYNSQGAFWTKGVCISRIRDDRILSPESQAFLDQCSTIRRKWGGLGAVLSRDISVDFVQNMFHHAHRLCMEISKRAYAVPAS